MRSLGGIGLVLSAVAVACSGVPDVGTTGATTAAPTTTTVVASTVVDSTAVAPTTTTVELAGPGYGGAVVIADDQEPPTLNPYVEGGDNFIVRVIGQAHHVGVWDIDGTTLERIPEVVSELPSVANGGVVVHADGTMTVRYLIRDDAVWADGVPISGGDFQFTYETLVSPDVSAQRELADDVYDEIVATEVGDKTFSVTLARATIAHENLFSVLVPRHEVAGTDFLQDWNETAWVAGGPFEVSEWVKGERLTLTRNANYWKSDPETGLQLPFLDSVTFRFIPETESLLAAFRNRDVDVIQPPPSVDTIESLRAREADGAAVTVRTGPVWEHLNFQFGPGRLERNPDSMVEHLAFRRAVAHLLDRDAIVVEAVAGHVEPLQSYVEAFTPTYSTRPWEQYGHDPDRAKALIGELCVELARDCLAKPLTVVFSTTSNADMRPRLATFMADMFAEVGIVYEQQLEDSQLFFGETLDNGRWDLGEWAWVGSAGLSGLVAIHDVFDPQAPPPDGFNYYRWGTPGSSVIDEHTVRFAELRDEMDATVDEEQIIALVQEAEQILADQVVIIPLFSRLTIGAVWADEIGGYEFNPSQGGHTWNIEWWYRVDR